MNNDPKNFAIVIATGAALIIIAALGYKTLSLSQELSSLQTKGSSSDSLMQELEEVAEQKNAQNESSLFDPWQSFAGDPFAKMQNMQQQMQRLFQNSGGFSNPFETSFSRQSNMPEIEVRETGDAYEVVVDYGPDSELELNTSLEDNVLSISATVRTQRSSFGTYVQSSASSYSQFSRSIALDKTVNASGLRTEQGEERVTIIVPFSS